jgi:hypothetical protein
MGGFFIGNQFWFNINFKQNFGMKPSRISEDFSAYILIFQYFANKK